MKPPSFIKFLMKSLVKDLKNVGIKAGVDCQQIPHAKMPKNLDIKFPGCKLDNRMWRIALCSKQFKHMSFLERQDWVWRAAEQALCHQMLNRVITILMVTPKEIGIE